MKIERHVALILGLSVLSGCAVSYYTTPEPKDDIPDRTPEIAVNQMDRTAVRRVLGTPKISSAYWGFDLFRADTKDTMVVFAITPVPIPFAGVTDQLQRFTLVSYGANGRADAVASGLFRRPAKWRNVSPNRRDFPSLHLRAGELMFFVDPEGARDINLLASPHGRDRFLQQTRLSNDCKVILGCGDRACADQVSVDAGPVRRLPLRTAHSYWLNESERNSWLQGVEPHIGSAPWLEAIVALELPPGEHVLEFSAKHLLGKTSVNLECHPGEVSFSVIWATSNERFLHPTLVDWQIDRTDTMPERFAQRPLVLMDDGQWYINGNPAE